MSGFRSGMFDREAAGLLKHFCPVQAAESILDVDLAALRQRGKKLLLIDVDNTIVAWRSEEIPHTTTDWIKQAKELGFDVCIISNTRHVERLKRLSEGLGIEYMIGRFKPSRRMFRAALEKYKAKPEEAIMVGDQIFTDVLGANRTGIEAIWVRQMAPIDLVTTKISRFGERVLRRRLYRAMKESPLLPDPPEELEEAVMNDETALDPGQEEEDLPVGGSAAFELLQSPIVRQFVKFAIVGGTSTVIDVGLHWLLMFHVPWNDGLASVALGHWLVDTFPGIFSGLVKDGNVTGAAVPVFKVLTASLAIVNSFIWNRRWTFKIRGKKHRALQFQKFIVIAVIGLLLNTLITTSLHQIIPGHPKRSLAIATIIATIVVAFWNFFGQKLWTFKHKH